jgi:hypothetical protein
VGTVIGALAARLLGLVLVVAAFGKGLDPAGFAADIAALGILPARLAPLAAVAGIAGEAGLGAALLAGLRRPAVLVATNLTFAVFLAVVTREYLWPSAAGGSCGCFGALAERTPGQAVVEDVVFLGLSGLAWLGRPRAAGRGITVGVAGLAIGAGFAIISPFLPLDDVATKLVPGARIADGGVGKVAPELGKGRHLVLLLDRKDETTRQAMRRVNEHLALAGGAVDVVGLAAEDRALEAEFLWTAGPAFTVHGVPAPLLRTLARRLPRAALVEDGVVARVWNEIPGDAALDRLARGDAS